jgi:PAS domain S-box-containing protein
MSNPPDLHRKLFASAPGAMLVIRRGSILESNPSAERLLGRPREAILGQPASVLGLAGLDGALAAALDGVSGRARAWFGEPPRRLEMVLCRLDAAAGEEAPVLLSLSDVTERDEAVERLRSLVDNLTGVVLTLEPSGRLLSISRTVPGAGTSDQVVGRSAFDFVLPDHHATLRSNIDEVLRSGQPTSYVLEGFGPQGAPAWYASRLSALRRDGEIVAVTMVTEDITAHRRTQDELGRKNLELEQEIAERERVNAAMRAQQEAMRALSTPILQVWDGVLALPLIGTMDDARAQQMSERLLHEIGRSRASFVILDLTGAEGMDTSTVSHLARIVDAARLLGSRCLISGVSPAIARTMVELDVHPEGLASFGQLQDALGHALRELRAQGRRAAAR